MSNRHLPNMGKNTLIKFFNKKELKLNVKKLLKNNFIFKTMLKIYILVFYIYKYGFSRSIMT